MSPDDGTNDGRSVAVRETAVREDVPNWLLHAAFKLCGRYRPSKGINAKDDRAARRWGTLESGGARRVSILDACREVAWTAVTRVIYRGARRPVATRTKSNKRFYCRSWWSAIVVRVRENRNRIVFVIMIHRRDIEGSTCRTKFRERRHAYADHGIRTPATARDNANCTDGRFVLRPKGFFPLYKRKRRTINLHEGIVPLIFVSTRPLYLPRRP